MSHASTFLFASLYLLLWWRIRDAESTRSWFLLGLTGGFLSICRWQDVLYLSGPFIYDALGGIVFRTRGWWKSRALFGVGVAICWAPQLMEWKAIYGKYLTIPQGGGIFSFPPAHMLQVLFSSQGGWFIWTPLTLFGVIGLFTGLFRAARIYLPWLIVLTLQTAVVGSVPFWHGLDSFGARYMLSNTPLVGLGLMTLFCALGPVARRTLATASVVCCVFTSVFAIQYRFDLVPTGTTLTASELFTDKFRLSAVKQRRAAAAKAKNLLARGDAQSAAEAIATLESVAPLGEDRRVDQTLAAAYRAAGKPELADAAGQRLDRFLESRLF
jgi:hypothetical protein